MLWYVSADHSFLLLSNISLYGYTILCLSIHLLRDIGAFQLLVIMNKAAMNIHIQVFVWAYVFMELLRHVVNACLANFQIVFIDGSTVLHSP